uniref:Conserved hypothetical Ustilaginaceae-specific protein n=1 Tax=Melanopsichium pennsylvanicum 4 TaxID=1398559 RepID=A0A077R7E0_9BASI|nr:conserved hypothetical Ustilaginaceae-specific protein [Melanopsichium pennsylvanicum 4]
MCVRRSDADAGSGYPSADRQFRGFLDLTDLKVRKVNIQERVAIFITAWFFILAKDLQTIDLDNKSNYLKPLDHYSSDDIVQRRKLFFERVLAKAKDMISDRASPESNKIFEQHLVEPVLNLSQEMCQLQGYCCCSDDRIPPVFVANDECAELPSPALFCLRRLWNYVRDLEIEQPCKISCLWLVLLSTNSGAASLVSQDPQVEASLRHVIAAPLPMFV